MSSLLKLKIYTFLIVCGIGMTIFYFVLSSINLSEPADEKKLTHSELIQNKMYNKAKAAAFGMNEFSATRYKEYPINDSIIYCIQDFTVRNDYNVKKTYKTYSYFNKNTGDDISAYIDTYASDLELSYTHRLK